MAVGTLYLIPTPLGEGELAWVMPEAVRQRAAELAYYIVEHPKTARRFLKQIGCIQPLQKISMSILDEHTPCSQLPNLLIPLLKGADGGLLSEAGCPAVADPGAKLVRLAHQRNVSVVPLVGPSSILLALMASGLNGQHFAFHGYLPIEAGKRAKKNRGIGKRIHHPRPGTDFYRNPLPQSKARGTPCPSMPTRYQAVHCL